MQKPPVLGTAAHWEDEAAAVAFLGLTLQFSFESQSHLAKTSALTAGLNKADVFFTKVTFFLQNDTHRP